MKIFQALINKMTKESFKTSYETYARVITYNSNRNVCIYGVSQLMCNVINEYELACRGRG